MDEELSDKDLRRERWQRHKAGNKKGFHPKDSARKTFNEHMLDSIVSSSEEVTVDYRCGGERELLTGKLVKDGVTYFVENRTYAKFSAHNVIKFSGYFPNPKNLPMTIVVRKWE